MKEKRRKEKRKEERKKEKRVAVGKEGFPRAGSSC
jgi:hypothetical protein